MRTRKEIESTLRFAEQRYAAELLDMNTNGYDTPEYDRARYLSALWAGRVDAYRFVLNEERPA